MGVIVGQARAALRVRRRDPDGPHADVRHVGATRIRVENVHVPIRVTEEDRVGLGHPQLIHERRNRLVVPRQAGAHSVKIAVGQEHDLDLLAALHGLVDDTGDRDCVVVRVRGEHQDLRSSRNAGRDRCGQQQGGNPPDERWTRRDDLDRMHT